VILSEAQLLRGFDHGGDGRVGDFATWEPVPLQDPQVSKARPGPPSYGFGIMEVVLRQTQKRTDKA